MGQKYQEAIKRINDIFEAVDGVTDELTKEAESDYARMKIVNSAADMKATLNAVICFVDGDRKNVPARDVAMNLVMAKAVTSTISAFLEDLADD